MFGNIEIEKSNFRFFKFLININNVDIDIIMTSNKDF